MSGLEQEITPELEASVTGGLKMSTELASLRVGDLAGSLTSGGSANWPPVGWAVRYRGGEAVATDQWRRFFAASRETFMGTEMFSLIYWWGHVLPVAAVAQHADATADAPMAAAADEWLRYYFGVMELMRDPVSGAILMVGMRSGGHKPEGAATWLGWLRALARGEDLGPWEARGKELHLGMRNRWEYRTAKALQSTLAKPAASTEPLPAYGLMAPIHIYRTEEGLAVWCEKNVNGNTTPLMGAVSIFGKSLDYLPAEGGKRIRQKFEHVTCAPVGGQLVYESNLQGRQELPLPGGAVVKEVTLGTGTGGGGAIVPIDPKPVDPMPIEPKPIVVAPSKQAESETKSSVTPAKPPIEQPAEPSTPPGPDLSAVADIVAGLRLPNKQKALQGRLVDELRNGPQRPLAAIADEVATFGINPDQPQGKPWQEAIRLLRAA
jgi:hypothetical protein